MTQPHLSRPCYWIFASGETCSQSSSLIYRGFFSCGAGRAEENTKGRWLDERVLKDVAAGG